MVSLTPYMWRSHIQIILYDLLRVPLLVRFFVREALFPYAKMSSTPGVITFVLYRKPLLGGA
jgi:hypothetical protein